MEVLADGSLGNAQVFRRLYRLDAVPVEAQSVFVAVWFERFGKGCVILDGFEVKTEAGVFILHRAADTRAKLHVERLIPRGVAAVEMLVEERGLLVAHIAVGYDVKRVL